MYMLQKIASTFSCFKMCVCLCMDMSFFFGNLEKPYNTITNYCNLLLTKYMCVIDRVQFTNDFLFCVKILELRSLSWRLYFEENKMMQLWHNNNSPKLNNVLIIQCFMAIFSHSDFISVLNECRCSKLPENGVNGVGLPPPKCFSFWSFSWLLSVLHWLQGWQ